MAKLTSSAADTAKQKSTGTFAATGQSTATNFQGGFNVVLWGTFVATVKLEKSFDGGTTWIVVATDKVGTAASYTAPVAVTFDEPEAAVLYRLNCSAYTSGTVNYRISR